LMIAERETRLRTFPKLPGTDQNLRCRKNGRMRGDLHRQTISVLVADDIVVAAALSTVKRERASSC
jgi:hypothetical protein